MRKADMGRWSIYCGILFIAGLSACASTPPPKPAPLPIEPEPAPIPVVLPPQGTSKELFKAGVDALQHGDGEKAKPLLQQVVVLEPTHQHASGLLAQINANPVEMLGKDYFIYKVQPGDTLSSVAKRFLGDKYKFFILARYNDIIISHHLEAGREIRIPGKKPPPGRTIAVEKPVIPDIPNQRLSEAKKLYADERFADSINVLEGIQSEGDGNAESNDLLLAVYTAYSKKLTDSGQFAEANKVLSKATAVYPGNDRLKKQNNQNDAYRNAGQYYSEGTQWLNDGQLVKAYEAFFKAVKLAPDHAGAKEALAKIKPQVVEIYYTDSVRARRRQNFTEAISSLDKLLEIQPNHQLARSNRMEIKALLDREQSGKRNK